LLYRLAICVFLCGLPAAAAEQDALAISANIQARHLPFGTILDPVFDSSGNVTGYSRCGDSAIWTGHYLAAEAFRYQVTKDPAALSNAIAALRGIKGLVDVTGYNSLARCYIPKDSPYAGGLIQEESRHGIYEGRCLDRACQWVGNTSRDQYAGVFFGLGAAWEMIGDPGVRSVISDLVTRMLNRLLDDNWAVIMPDGSVSTVFWLRPDQKLSLLAIGARINPDRFSSKYRWSRFFEGSLTATPVLPELADLHGSYFKFNLDVLTFYHLVKWEGNRTYHRYYEDAYKILRRTIDGHGNAHFNMIDRAIRGPDTGRDEETRALLEQWLQRPRRDDYIDLRGVYAACGEDRACDPIPVPRRVRTDFLWQRSPFLLYGGGEGKIETAGIDYILPYWMARFHGVL